MRAKIRKQEELLIQVPVREFLLGAGIKDPESWLIKGTDGVFYVANGSTHVTILVTREVA